MMMKTKKSHSGWFYQLPYSIDVPGKCTMYLANVYLLWTFCLQNIKSWLMSCTDQTLRKNLSE